MTGIASQPHTPHSCPPIEANLTLFNPTSCDDILSDDGSGDGSGSDKNNIVFPVSSTPQEFGYKMYSKRVASPGSANGHRRTPNQSMDSTCFSDKLLCDDIIELSLNVPSALHAKYLKRFQKESPAVSPNSGSGCCSTGSMT
jgi:hypothetical protein